MTRELISSLTHSLKTYFSDRAVIYQSSEYRDHVWSFSQEGEDRVLQRFFGDSTKGFYVDVGAHHPRRYSNTYAFYLQGWRGINIDPLPGVQPLFEQSRPRDITLTCGVADTNGFLNYYLFKEPAYNTFNPDYAAKTPSKLLSVEQVEMFTLREILEKHLPLGQSIDFLTVDVEGFDELVLRSNDWSRYRPKYVLAEVFGVSDIEIVIKSSISEYMRSVGYLIVGKTVNTVFFKDRGISDASNR